MNFRMGQEALEGTFSPDTGNAAEVVARTAPLERLWETPAQRSHRLAVQVGPHERVLKEGVDATTQGVVHSIPCPAHGPHARLALASSLPCIVFTWKTRK